MEIYDLATRKRSMDLKLNGQVALVTASCKGIGRAVVKRLAQEGARVAMSSSTAERLSAVAFLASPESAFTTGASLQLDGGAIRSAL